MKARVCLYLKIHLNKYQRNFMTISLMKINNAKVKLKLDQKIKVIILIISTIH